jgi:hypothetical protein
MQRSALDAFKRRRYRRFVGAIRGENHDTRGVSGGLSCAKNAAKKARLGVAAETEKAPPKLP